GDLQITSDLTTIRNLEVDSLQIGSSGANVFVGLNGPYRSDTNGDGVIDSADDPADPDAVGLAIENVDFGFVTMAPTLAALPGFDQILPKFTAIKATADAAGLVGMGDVLTASIRNVLVEVNNGTTWGGSGVGPPVIDFAASFATDEITDFFDFDGDRAIEVSDLLSLAGSETALTDLGFTDVGTTTRVVSVEELLSVLDANGDEQLQVTEASLVGAGAAAADADGDGKLDPPGYEIRTGTTTAPVYIDYDGNQRIGAAADSVELVLGEFVHVIGSFSFEKGPTHKVDVATGLPAIVAGLASDLLTGITGIPEEGSVGLGDLQISADFSTIRNLEVDSLQIGTSGAHIFLGVDGPYYTDTNGDGFVSDETTFNEDAVGLIVDGVDLGFVTMAPTLAALPGFDRILPKFTALSASADVLAFVGLPEVQMSLEGINVDVNTGQAWPGGLGPPVIDFQASFPDDEIGLFFDQNGDGQVTVGDLRTIGGFDGLNIYVTATADDLDPVTFDDLVDSDLDANGDGMLQITEISSIGTGAGGISAQDADIDGDGKLDPIGYEIRTGTNTAPVYIAHDGNQRFYASVERATVQISEFVHITGSLAFEKGPVRTVQLAEGGIDLTGNLEDLLDSFDLDPGLASYLVATEAELEFMTIAASNVHAFVGINGPYWNDVNEDGVLDAAEINHDAVGLVVDDFDFGMALMTSTNPLLPSKYTALKATASSISLEGIDDVTLAAEQVLVEVNLSSPSVYGLSLFPVVDFASTWASERLALFDTSGDGIVTVGELRALNGGAPSFGDLYDATNATDDYIAMSDLVDELDTNGDGILQVAEAAVLTGATAATNADADEDDKIDPAGLELRTGGDPIYLSADSSLVRAQGFVQLDIFGAVIVTGSVAFELGPTQDVVLTDGSDVSVTTMTIGAANVNAFIGANGPYWTDLDGDHEVSYSDADGNPLDPSVADDGDGVVEVGETAELSADAVGFAITDLDLGIMVMASTLVSDAGVYLALDASVYAFGLVGIDAVTATGTFDVSMNVGIGVSGFEAVNFVQSFPDKDGPTGPDEAGFEVNTGNPAAPVLLDFDTYLVSIKLGGKITITDVFELTGLFLLDVNPDGLKLFVAAGLEIGSTDFLDLSALGAIVINGEGLAFDLDISFNLGNVDDISSDPGIVLQARVMFNNTGKNQEILIPDKYVQFLDGAPDGEPVAPELATEISALGLTSLTGELGKRLVTISGKEGLYYVLPGIAPDLSTFDPDLSFATNAGTEAPTPGTYLILFLKGSLRLDADWGISGRFALVIDPNGFQMSVLGDLNLGFLGSIHTEGDLYIRTSTNTLVGRLLVNGQMGTDAIGLKITASGLFEVNTTGSSFDLNGVQVAPGLRVGFSATFDFLGFATGTGVGSVVFDGSGFQTSIKGSLEIGGGLTFDVLAAIGVYADGVLVFAQVDLDVDILNLFEFNLGGLLYINTTGRNISSYTAAQVDSNGFITGFGTVNFTNRAGNSITVQSKSFYLDLTGGFDILSVLQVSGGVIIEVSANAWSFEIPESNPLSVKLFGGGLLTMDLWGYVRSTGAFSLNFFADLPLNYEGNGFDGQVSLYMAFDPNRSDNVDTVLNKNGAKVNFRVTASGSGAAQLGGVDLIGASISLDAAGNLGGQVGLQLKVEGEGWFIEIVNEIVRMTKDAAEAAGYAIVNFLGEIGCAIASIWGGCEEWVEVEKPVEKDVFKLASFTINVGSFTLPASLVQQTPPPPVLATNVGGILYLNVGDRGNLRNVSSSAIAEDYSISRVSGAGGLNEIRVSAFGKTETFAGITGVVGHFGSGRDRFTANGITVPIQVSGGDDNDTLSTNGTGLVTLWGDNPDGTGFGSDIIGISGTPSASSVIRGGNGGDLITNNTGVNVPLYGEDGSDTIRGGWGNDTILSGGPGNDLISGRGGLDAADGGSGNDVFDELLADLRPGETFVGGSGFDRVTIRGTGGSDDLRVSVEDPTHIRIGSYVSGAESAFLLMSQTEDLNLLGGTSGADGSDTFTITGALDEAGLIGTVVIDLGTQGTDTVNLSLTNDADILTLSDAGTALTGSWAGHFSLALQRASVASGDRLNVYAMGGDDLLNAAGVATNPFAVTTLDAGADNDIVIGSPGVDVIYGGTGNDVLSGLGSTDTFHDAGGYDVLFELDSTAGGGLDFGLYGNYFITGSAVSGVGENSAVTSFTGAVTVENIAGLFEEVQLVGGTGENVFAIGSGTGQITAGGTVYGTTVWSGPVLLQGLTGNDTYVVELAGISATTVDVVEAADAWADENGDNVRNLDDPTTNDIDEAEHLLIGGGTDRMVFRGTMSDDSGVSSVDLNPQPSPSRGETPAPITAYSLGDSSVTSTRDIESNELYLLGGTDRYGIPALTTNTLVHGGSDSDFINVGSQATATINGGGELDDLDTMLTLAGGTGSDTL
ncbi:MAG: calcium-binding protein, partial [Pseudomonadales bacterium]